MNIHYHNVSTRAQEHKEINQCNTGGRKCPFLYEPSPSFPFSRQNHSEVNKVLGIQSGNFFSSTISPQSVWDEFHCLERCNRQIIQEGEGSNKLWRV